MPAATHIKAFLVFLKAFSVFGRWTCSPGFKLPGGRCVRNFLERTGATLLVRAVVCLIYTRVERQSEPWRPSQMCSSTFLPPLLLYQTLLRPAGRYGRR